VSAGTLGLVAIAQGHSKMKARSCTWCRRAGAQRRPGFLGIGGQGRAVPVKARHSCPCRPGRSASRRCRADQPALPALVGRLATRDWPPPLPPPAGRIIEPTMCHQPASASAGGHPVARRPGADKAPPKTACAASAAKPADVRWVSRAPESSACDCSAREEVRYAKRASGAGSSIVPRLPRHRAAGPDGATKLQTSVRQRSASAVRNPGTGRCTRIGRAAPAPRRPGGDRRWYKRSSSARRYSPASALSRDTAGRFLQSPAQRRALLRGCLAGRVAHQVRTAPPRAAGPRRGRSGRRRRRGAPACRVFPAGSAAMLSVR